MFSSRVPRTFTPNRLTSALDAQRRAGRRVVDLTQSNPTRAGLAYPPDLLVPLADPRGLVYRPHALGLPEARAAVAADYARRGIRVEPERIVLTASTSEAYSLLFKVLCDPGDEVLVPRPSYPLFEHLTTLDAVSAVPYALDYHGDWSIDIDSLERAVTPRSRAVLAVSPNNPTGSYLKRAELDALERVAAERDLALIVDEVFADYRLPDGDAAAFASPLAGVRALTFCLGGLSKSIGLPQAKLAWIAVAGPSAAIGDALGRLEFVCDTYLSVSTPVQAATELLTSGAPVRQAIQERVLTNFRHLRAAVGAAPACRVLRAEGGWYGVVQVPSLSTEEELVLDLLQGDGVLVHPGYFFDFPRESFLVVSLLPRAAEFAEGVAAIVRRFGEGAGLR